MASLDLDTSGLAGTASPFSFDDNDSSLSSPLSQPQRSTALANKITSVLSTSFADAEIRESLGALDEKNIRNTAEARRRLRLDVQKELIECNGDVVKDFGAVAERLKRIGSTIASLNSTCDYIRQHVNAANRETAPVIDEASTLLEQQQATATKQRLLNAFNAHFVLSEADLDALTSYSTNSSSSSQPSVVNDDAFFALLARLNRIHADCRLLLMGSGTTDTTGAESHQESANTTLGLELMERSSRAQNAAYQKLFRGVQREFRDLDLENPRVGASVRRALRVLAQRPQLFRECLEFFAQARERSLADAFYAALTGFSSSGEVRMAQTSASDAKPIEYYAHDSLRFVGDMLAWTHSATVSERESLEVLFISEGPEMAAGIKAGLESEPWLRPRRGRGLQEGEDLDENEDGDSDEPPVPVFDGQKSLTMLVNRDLAGVARALRQRIEQVIRSDEDSVLAFRIATLLAFYAHTFGRLLGGPPSTTITTNDTAASPEREHSSTSTTASAKDTSSPVLATLAALHASATQHFKSLANEHIASLPAAPAEDAQPPSTKTTATAALTGSNTSFSFSAADLDPPDYLASALTRLAALLKAHDSSVAPAGPALTLPPPLNTASSQLDSTAPSSSSPSDPDPFAPILTLTLDPFLTAARAQARAYIAAPGAAVAQVNALDAARSVLGGYSFVQGRAESLRRNREGLVRELEEWVWTELVGRSGMGGMVRALGDVGVGGPGPVSDDDDEDAEERDREDWTLDPMDLDASQLQRLASHPALQPAALKRASATLDAFLPSALMDVGEGVAGLRDKSAAEDLVARAAERFCEIFERVVAVLEGVDRIDRGGDGGEDGDGERLRECFSRTGGEIRVLLS